MLISKPATGNICLSLKDLVQDFLESRQHLRPKTLRYYRTCLRNFLWYTQENGWPTDAGEITRDRIQAFLNYVGRERNRWGYTEISRSSSRQASPATVHHYGRVVKILFNWAAEEEYLDHNPTLRLKLGSPQIPSFAMAESSSGSTTLRIRIGILWKPLCFTAKQGSYLRHAATCGMN